MKYTHTKVRSQHVNLGVVRVPIFQTLKEVLTHPRYGLGETAIIKLANAHVRGRLTNIYRKRMTRAPR